MTRSIAESGPGSLPSCPRVPAVPARVVSLQIRLAGHHALLGQAVRYLTEPAIREAAIAAVHEHLGDDTRVVLAHSLGSVVAYEAPPRQTARPQPLPLLITIGSPLGLPSVIRRGEFRYGLPDRSRLADSLSG